MAAWKEWLKVKYGTPERLSAAWNCPVAGFDDALPPSVKDFAGAQEFFDIKTEQRNIDWRRFGAERARGVCGVFCQSGA